MELAVLMYWHPKHKLYRGKKMKKLLKLMMAFLLLFSVGCVKDEKEPFTLSFINIGKGDAFLMENPGDGFYLCDTGKTQDFNKIARLLKVKNVDHLNGIFLSHGHLDHAGNVDALLKLIPTDKVYISKKDDASYQRMPIRQIVSENGVELVELDGKEHFEFNDLIIDIWLPETVDYENENNNSMVMYLTYGKTHYLMTGDMEKEEEKIFLSENKNISCDVLKLGHHGEKDATTKELLNRARPKYGIITGNEKENPQSVNDKVSKKLEMFNVKPFYSEGEQLAIDFISDQYTISIENVYNPEVKSNLEIQNIDFENQTITLHNKGKKELDISNYSIRSKKGEEWFYISEGTVLDAGASITVSTPGFWQMESGEAAVIYDTQFNKLDKRDWENNYE